MPRLILSSLAAFLLASGITTAAPLKTIKVGPSPESVCRGWGGKLYVTIINGDKPGDGEVVEVDGESVKPFAKGLSDPKGIVFVGDQLITSDGTMMWKIAQDGTATKLVEAKDFPAPVEFLNDVAVAEDGKSVYVTEMSSPGPMFDPSGERKLWDLDSEQAKTLPVKGCVYRVSLDGKVQQVVPPGNVALRFPNGVTVGQGAGNNQLYVGDFFTGQVHVHKDGKLQSVVSGVRGVDGLTVTPDAIYISSWNQGKVWKFDRKTQQLKVLHEGLTTAADFFYDEAHQQLIVPDMLAGTLVFLPVK